MSSTDDLVRNVGALLNRRGATVALAESCTGGMVLAALTSVAGASAYVWGGLVVYGSEAKERLAGLDRAWLEEHGTVSAATTGRLARAVQELSKCTLGLAVTGWAGPGGGTEQDPVGTVYLALADAGEVQNRRHVFAGNRDDIRLAAVDEALRWLREWLSDDWRHRAGR